MMPRATYCHPQVASMGLTEAQAREQGYDVKIGRFNVQASGKAVAMGENDGLVKLVIDAKYGELLGGHLCGPEVTELLGELSMTKLLEGNHTGTGLGRARSPYHLRNGARGSAGRRRPRPAYVTQHLAENDCPEEGIC